MAEPSRHVLQDTGAWPEAKLTDVLTTMSTTMFMDYDATRKLILMPDAHKVDTYSYDSSSGNQAFRSSIVVDSAVAVYFHAKQDRYYISSSGNTSTAVHQYDPATDNVVIWCTFPQGSVIYGSDSNVDSLFVVGLDVAGKPAVWQCSMKSEGPQSATPLAVQFELLVTTDSPLGCLNDVVVDSNRLFVTNGHDVRAPTKTANVTGIIGGIFSIDLTTLKPSWFVENTGLPGIEAPAAMLRDGDDLVVVQNPGSRLYKVAVKDATIHFYQSFGDDDTNLFGVAVVSKNHIIMADHGKVFDWDEGYLPSGQYVHDPSRNCISSNNERIHCLTPLGITTTLVFTYSGFILLAWGSFWNADLIGKLREIGDEWKKLNGRA